jgi:outer membrane usher protein
MASLDLSARAGPLSFYGDALATAGRFFDLAALSGEAFPRFRYDAGISASLGGAGALSLGWIGTRGETHDDLMTASYSLPFGKGFYFGLTGFRDFSSRSWAAQMLLSVPLDGATVSASASTGSGDDSVHIAYDKPANPDGGFGYGLRASTLRSQRAEADARWIGDDGELDGAVALANGRTALRVNASGGLVFLDNRLFATRSPDGAVALVETGAPDVRIYRENRVVAHSGADGDALIAGLNPYAGNRIGIEPRDYPMDADLAAASRVVVPPRGAGVVVNLAPAVRHSFIAVMRLGNGAYPPVGALVRAHRLKTPLLVGRDGEVYFGGLAAPVEVTIETGSGRCHALVVPPSPQPGRIPRTGPFLCSNELADAR